MNRNRAYFKSVVAVAILFAGALMPSYGTSVVCQYDSLSRLISITYPNGTQISYTYDAAGNRLAQVVSDGSTNPGPTPTPDPTPTPTPTPNFDQALDFNDGQLPSGWYIAVHPDKVSHTGVANQRFEARPVDTYSGLRHDVQLPANATAITIEYTGNITTNYWGQYTQANLLMDDGASYGTHLGKNWDGLNSIVASAGTGDAPEFLATFPLNPGSYRITAIFEDEKITYTATKLGAEAPLFSEVVVVPGLDIHRLKTIELQTATTSGDPSWIDDVVIRQTIPTPQPTVLFEDDFDDNAIDPVKWTPAANVVTETGQQMQVKTTVTDKGGWIASETFALANRMPVTVTRRVRVHYGNDNFMGKISFHIGDLPGFGILYTRMTYNPWPYAARTGFYISRNGPAPAYMLSAEPDLSPAIAPVWDTWFEEKITYDPATGNLEYFINNTSMLVYNVGPLPESSPLTMRLEANAWGWYTGHEHFFDDLIVAQASDSTPGPSISTASVLPGGTLGSAYSAALAVTGGPPPFTWSLVSGALPSGLILGANGSITGTPSSTGDFTFTARVTGSDGQSATRSFTLAVATAASNFAYTVTGSTVTITGLHSNFEGDLALPSAIDGKPVTAIGDFAFNGRTGLTSVTIPSTVTSIGDAAFQGASGLTSVTIPPGVTVIGDYAFSGCSGLTSFTFPSSLVSIGDYAFSLCTGLTSVEIPPGVTTIGEGPFSYCSSLESITVAAGNTAFSSLDGVLFDINRQTLVQYPNGKPGSSYEVPDGVTTIGSGAFTGSALTNVTLPSSLSSVTTLDEGNTSRLIEFFSFESLIDWVIGETTDGNSVTLSEPSEAFVNTSGKAVYIGKNAGSDDNALILEGYLETNAVYIGSTEGNTGNALQLEDNAGFGIESFYLAPENTLRIKGDYTNIDSLLGYLNGVSLQVWESGSWQAVTSDNHASLINISVDGSYTVVTPGTMAPPTPTPTATPTPKPTATPKLIATPKQTATPTATPGATATPEPGATPADESTQAATYYYEQSQQAYDYYAGQGDMGAAYYYAYTNAASALYYQNVSTDYNAAIIGYYVNTGYGLLYYYMAQGNTNYGLYLYYANLASASYTLGYFANYHTFNGQSLYYYFIDTDPTAAMYYFTEEAFLAVYYQQYGYYSDTLAQY